MNTSVELNQIIHERYQLQQLIHQSDSECVWQVTDKLHEHDQIVLQELVVTETHKLSQVFVSFQTELNTLASFSHPQVEQIKDVFHTADRLFIVKSLIVSELERQIQASSESEIVELLKQILPILSQLHQLPASHRNISPESIVRRASDRLPVLTNFAPIADIKSQLCITDRQLRLIDRIRQLPIGFISPGVGEDLYCLGVTAIMLLTGKSIEELFDPQNRTWEWETWKLVSDRLGSVLNKMLSPQPMERFTSADTVLSALNNPRSTVVQPLVANEDADSEDLGYNNSRQYASHPTNPTPEQMIATATAAAQATKIVATAAASAAAVQATKLAAAAAPVASATVDSLQKTSANISSNLKKVDVPNWHKAALIGGGTGVLLLAGLAGGKWYLSTKSEPQTPASIITPSTSSTSATSSPSPAATTVPATETTTPAASTALITKETAVSIVQQWLSAKRTLFAPPYDRELGSKLLTEAAYQNNIDKSGSPTCNQSDPDSCSSSMDWLRNRNAQYTYGVQKIDSIGEFQVNGDRATIFVTVTEYRTLHEGSKSTSSGGSNRTRYDLKYENGNIKITDYKVLK
jgi:serine/threonine protein kinase